MFDDDNILDDLLFFVAVDDAESRREEKELDALERELAALDNDLDDFEDLEDLDDLDGAYELDDFDDFDDFDEFDISDDADEFDSDFDEFIDSLI